MKVSHTSSLLNFVSFLSSHLTTGVLVVMTWKYQNTDMIIWHIVVTATETYFPFGGARTWSSLSSHLAFIPQASCTFLVPLLLERSHLMVSSLKIYYPLWASWKVKYNWLKKWNLNGWISKKVALGWKMFGGKK